MPKATARGPIASAAIRAWYQRWMIDLLKEMRDSALWWVGAVYKRRQSEITMDASPAVELDNEIDALITQWERRYNEIAMKRSKMLAGKVDKAATLQMANSLAGAGISVKFTNSRRVNDVLQSVVRENMSHVVSVPRHFLNNVRGIVMRGIQNGRDEAYIADKIEHEFGLERYRAVRLAFDQINKATEALGMARAEDIGVTHGFWMHRSGSKKPRQTHVDFDGERFALNEGLYDEDVGEYVKPGQLINCGCTFVMDLETIGGLKDETFAHDAAISLNRARERVAVFPSATAIWRDAWI